MFGQQQGGGGQEVPRGNDVKMDLDLTLEQLYVGDVVEMMKPSLCVDPTPIPIHFFLPYKIMVHSLSMY